jgi:type IV secretion system protein VirD4
LAQLKALFEKQWEGIIGNFDEFLYLGGNEASTHKYVSELLGKETFDTNTFGKSTGRNGNYSTNYQNAGRELLTPDEVRMLDNRYAILFIRGERPVMDEKYDIMRHPNVGATTDGQGKVYDHGAEHRSIGAIQIVGRNRLRNPVTKPAVPSNYALYSESDVEDYFIMKERGEYETPEKPIENLVPAKKWGKQADEEEKPVYPIRRVRRRR